MESNVSIRKTALIMGKSEQFVRCGLQDNLFPFGFAVRKPGNEQFNYFVSPYQLYTYLGRFDLLEKWKQAINENYGKLSLERGE